MKTLRLILACTLAILTTASVANAELLTDRYGVNISDKNEYSDGNVLYQLFNNYFGLTEETGAYTSSNDLFNDLGVDPTTQWSTSGSELIGAFKVASLGHEMSVVSTDGEKLGSIINIGGTTNIYDKNGITDLGDSSVLLPDGHDINFQLDAKMGDSTVLSWSSDQTENGGLMPSGVMGDDQIHMVAFDITDIYNETFGTEFDSVYMLGWEDLHELAAGTGYPADWDYQDFVAIVTNLTPSVNTPEPATWCMFLLGGAGTSVLAWRKRRAKKSE